MAIQVQTEATVRLMVDGAQKLSANASITQSLVSYATFKLQVAASTVGYVVNLGNLTEKQYLFLKTDKALTLQLATSGTEILLPAGGFLPLQGLYTSVLLTNSSSSDAANVEIIAGDVT
jgi:hypothetical protein